MPSIASNPAIRSNLELQVNFMTELTQKTYDAMRKLSEMNLHMAKRLFEDSLSLGRELMSCTDPFQLVSASMKRMPEASEHLRDYQQQLMSLLAGAQVELTRVAETHIPEASRAASALSDEMMRNVVAGAAAHSGNGSANARDPAHTPG
jgi:phasin family protein